ncbi:MAG: S-ribosylhomocysteine lyase [Treponema sp.]|jgi:S-ribosylhomocysteine lyase|nr:S-ribosylhomocysteine lyase [Treponema sp.]
MEKIASFRVDHLRLKRGVFVSRRDRFGSTVLTTFDLRFREPNKEPVIDQPALHTIEHLGATFLRSHGEWGSRIVYFGPMGCRTGFYLIVEGELESPQILPLLREMLDWIGQFEGDIPGAAPSECGNWREQNLDMAKWEGRRYAEVVKNPQRENLVYPE